MYALLLLALLERSQALLDSRPQQTAVNLAGDALGLWRMSTGVMRIEAPALTKRAVPDKTCGYISANYDEPITCGATNYCAVNTNYGVFGCCSTYTVLSNGLNTYSGCTFASRCYDSTDITSCTGTCTSDPLVGSCPNSAAPYCQTFSLTDQGLSGFACGTASGVTYRAQITPTTTFSLTTSGSATQGPSIVNTGGANAAGGTAPTTTVVVSSSSKSSVVGPAVGGTIGGVAVLLIAIGGFFWLRMKHKKQAAAAAAAAAAAGAPSEKDSATAAGPAVPTKGAGTAGGAYGVNEYYNPGNDPNKEPVSTANTPLMSQAYLTGDVSEMPGSPPPNATAHNNQFGAQSPLAEVEGSTSTAPGPKTQIQRKSVGSNSLLTGGGERTELDSSSVSGRAQSPLLSDSTLSPIQQGPDMGYRSGPTTEWNRPYHELE